MTTLEGTPEPTPSTGESETFEFFSDNSVEITDVHTDGKVDKVKGTYKLSNNDTELNIRVGDSFSGDYTFDGTKIGKGSGG